MRQLHTNPMQKGFTLVELMIAMVLSLLLMAGATSMFLSSKKTFKTQEELARIQENMRYVVTRMVTDISPAGFHGCAPSAQGGESQVKSTVTSANGLHNFDNAIAGAEGGGPNNSDSLTVRFALPEYGMPIIAPMTAEDRAVRVNSSHPAYEELSQGDIIAVSDCSLLAVFMITNEPGADGRLTHLPGITINGITNSTDETTHYFGGESLSSAMAIKMDAVTYDLGIVTNNGATVSSLYATRLGGNRQQILSGVEDFQVSYGIDTTNPPDGTSDRYIIWDTVAAEQLNSRIASIRIALTINSGEPIPGTTGLNQDFTEEMEFVVKLRNRLTDL